MNQTENILAGFGRLQLNEILHHDVARTDLKFVVPATELPGLLQTLTPFYKALDINNRLVFAYSTQYFDTPGFDTYLEHHNGRNNRFKVRLRSYLDTGRHYLELKQKTNTGKTIKYRTGQLPGEPLYQQPAAGFITAHTTLNPQLLLPVICIRYNRISLFDTGTGEKITIDTGLEFFRNDASHKLSNFAVIEVKQFTKAKTPVLQLLKNMKKQPVAFSKYCFGINCLYPQLKKNRFKPKWNALNKILNDQFTAPVTAR